MSKYAYAIEDRPAWHRWVTPVALGVGFGSVEAASWHAWWGIPYGIVLGAAYTATVHFYGRSEHDWGVLTGQRIAEMLPVVRELARQLRARLDTDQTHKPHEQESER